MKPSAKLYVSGPTVLLDPPFSLGDRVLLDKKKAHHLVHVLRLVHGAPLHVQDGQGNACDGILDLESRQPFVRITSTPEPVPGQVHPVDLILAMPRHETFNTVIRQAVELGVRRLFPVISERSIVPRGVATGKADYWERVMTAACEQSGRATRMEIMPVGPLATCLEQDFSGFCRLFFWEQAIDNREPWGLVSGQDTVAAVGPEGGWSTQEAELFHSCGFATRSLGHLVLRVDTAVVTIAAVCIHGHRTAHCSPGQGDSGNSTTPVSR